MIYTYVNTDHAGDDERKKTSSWLYLTTKAHLEGNFQFQVKVNVKTIADARPFFGTMNPLNPSHLHVWNPTLVITDLVPHSGKASAGTLMTTKIIQVHLTHNHLMLPVINQTTFPKKRPRDLRDFIAVIFLYTRPSFLSVLWPPTLLMADTICLLIRN